MTINLREDRRPLGILTWVAYLRDGTTITEFDGDQPQKSVDCLADRDVAQLHLVPVDGSTRNYVRIDAQPGEVIKKKWIRTYRLAVDGGSEDAPAELPVIDAFMLISEKRVWHYVFSDGVTLITTSEEP